MDRIFGGKVLLNIEGIEVGSARAEARKASTGPEFKAGMDVLPFGPSHVFSQAGLLVTRPYVGPGPSIIHRSTQILVLKKGPYDPPRKGFLILSYAALHALG